jgi:flavin-binding protein dodecin
MPDATYKLIEIVGVSEDSIQQAVRNGLEKASRTLRNLDWFEVTQIRGAILDNNRPQFQVEMRVGFRLLDRDVLAGGDLEGTSSGGKGGKSAKGGRAGDGKKKKKGK